MKKYALLVALLAIFSDLAFAKTGFDENRTVELEGITVTASQDESLRVHIDPKSPVSPIPPSDGAGLLKNIPNFSVTRKGGSSGDPLFRGLGGSRLPITTDDNFLYGGCGGRMDPPTAYIFPSSYDRVMITKGPQTVIYPGIITGAVQFVRDDVYFEKSGAKGDAGVTAGSFGRFDGFADITAGARFGYVRVNGVYSKQDDYKSGNGESVHSKFERNSQMAQIGLTPDEYTLAEFTYDVSRGEAAYADRMMDGSKFDKDAYRIKLSKDDISDTFKRVNFQYGYSYVDHVMDNYNLREAMGTYRASNPDRRTQSANLGVDFSVGAAEIKAGLDWLDDRHRARSGSGMNATAANSYKYADRTTDQEADNMGIFAEANIRLTDEHLLVAGVRHDRSNADYFTNGTKSKEQKFDLNAAFLRYEYYSDGFTYFAGIGLAQRIPDFWERNKNKNLDKESNTQIDAGILYKNDGIRGSFNIFASEIDDFILVYSNSTAKNIDAKRYGFEGEAEWEFVKNYKLGLAAAYTYGKNRSDDKALGQTPPFETKVSLGYDNDIVSAAVVTRYVAAKHRIAVGEGNIIGQDIAKSGDFAVISINGSWKINKNMGLFLGADNIFDKECSEFISKGSYDVAGYNQPLGVQISEPGRQFWARIQGKF
ncbi:MAG: TonB-dependent copper receptor [Campylobacteraceae bacterium]|jgi:iron complex outermembrane receptor protein|nr:TonB-dependent copper receptor [Campylobacteraceae bacterium]